jgi:hypothetical protein
MNDAHDVLAAYWAAAEARDWDTFAGDHYPGLCFFDLDADGKIARITDFWPERYELPASRTHLVERY